MQQWVTWIIALVQSLVQWLGSCQILGVSVLWIIVGVSLIGLLLRSVLFRP